jgi:hypothetical protein
MLPSFAHQTVPMNFVASNDSAWKEGKWVTNGLAAAPVIVDSFERFNHDN